MTDGEMRLKGQEIVNMMRDITISDNVIIEQIKERDFLVGIKLMSGRNLFMEAVNNNRLIVAKALKGMGADVYLKCDGSLTLGNALNLAKSSEMIDYLHEIGLEVINKFDMKEKEVHPAILWAKNNKFDMVDLWRNKAISANTDQDFMHDLNMGIVKQITMMNQVDGLVYLLKDDALYSIYMNEIRPNVSDDALKMTKKGLKAVQDLSLADRIKEIGKKR